MRNLIPILLALVVLSSGCDPEDTSGYNCTPEGCFADPANAQYLTLEDCLSACDEENNTNQSGGPWSFEIKLNGNTYAAAGDCGNPGNYSTGYATLANGLMTINLKSLDPSSENYISGGYISMTLTCENPFVGVNGFTISGTDDLIDYLPNSSPASLYATLESAWMLDNTTTMAELGYYYLNGYWVGNGFYTYPNLNFNLTSLGTYEVESDPSAWANGCLYIGENIEGSYNATLYFQDLSSLSAPPTQEELNAMENIPFTVPLEIEVSFSVTRVL